MKSAVSVLFSSALLLGFAPAAEVTVESKPFFIERTIMATALPGVDCVVYKLNPKTWSDFKIIQVTPHGSKVAKGDAFEPAGGTSPAFQNV